MEKLKTLELQYPAKPFHLWHAVWGDIRIGHTEQLHTEAQIKCLREMVEVFDNDNLPWKVVRGTKELVYALDNLQEYDKITSPVANAFVGTFVHLIRISLMGKGSLGQISGRETRKVYFGTPNTKRSLG